MKDEEILARHAELTREHEQIWSEWQAYDRQYPVIPGAYKPPDYDQQQRRFLARLRGVSEQSAALPRTSAERMRMVLTVLAVVLVVAGLLAWVFVIRK